MKTRELKTKSQLNEGFAIIKRNHNDMYILFVNGFQIDDEYAVIYEHERKLYTVTHIESGARVGSEFVTFREIKTMYEKIIQDARKRIKKDSGKCVEKAIELFEKLMREQKWECKD